jgi:hypothetical protein
MVDYREEGKMVSCHEKYGPHGYGERDNRGRTNIRRIDGFIPGRDMFIRDF